jgi:hypothetical protein
MDVLELTAVSAIVLDLLSGFQRPSRFDRKSQRDRRLYASCNDFAS